MTSINELSGCFLGQKEYRTNAQRLQERKVSVGCEVVTKLLLKTI